ncbi:MAG: DUF6114 domain-containing protein [Thermoplasmataceae archaeon]|nr:MAG: hypothetical protein AMDU2_EPLC00005G0023 [Thermoplasmatales archaeon E-plasma]
MAKRGFQNLDAAVSSIVGGAIILGVAFQIFLLIYNGTSGATLNSYLILIFGGFLPGIGIIVLSIISIFPDQNYKLLGGIISVISFLSWLGADGGFLIGFIMALIGGMMIYFNVAIVARSSSGPPSKV